MSTSLLPPSAYTSLEWWEEEQARLFAHTWHLVGDTGDLPGPGEYSAVLAGAVPILLVRDGNGELRAFHNLCRHRGMVLLDGRGNLGETISCEYHQWRYGLDGTLRAVPQGREQFPDIDRCALGLLRASVATWEGMVFVHPDAEAPPLESALAGVIEGIGSHRPGLLSQVALERIDAACNWKLLVENHVDVYHLWYLHEASLACFDHTRFEHRSYDNGNWWSYEPLRVNQPPPWEEPGALSISHLNRTDQMGVGAHLIFPNTMIAATAEYFATYVALPVAPERTVLELRVRAEPGADPKRVLQVLRSFIEEDIRACEGVALGLRSPAFSVGALARAHEAPILAFQAHLRSLLAR